MAFNNGFPVTYQPMYYPQQYQPAQTNPFSAAQSGGTTQQAQNSIIWVSGEAGAKAYLVAPNTTVPLWDSENQVIYLKSADASGMPSIKTLDYTIREMPQSHAPATGSTVYATKDDLEALRHEIEEMLAAKRTAVKTVKKEVDE